MNLNIQSAVEGDLGKLGVEGEVDVSNADSLREGIAGLLEDEQVKTIEVDLGEVPYIDSTGIGVLVGAAHRADEGGARPCAWFARRTTCRASSACWAWTKLSARALSKASLTHRPTHALKMWEETSRWYAYVRVVLGKRDTVCTRRVRRA